MSPYFLNSRVKDPKRQTSVQEKKYAKKDVFHWKDPVEKEKNQDHSGHDAL